jgi:hypothetical protein
MFIRWGLSLRAYLIARHAEADRANRHRVAFGSFPAGNAGRILPQVDAWMLLRNRLSNKSLLCLGSAFSIVGNCALALFFLVEVQPVQLPVFVALLAEIILADCE